ncbi:MAG: type II toxin-antitoxin system HicA family toxin [ANME-2 cluster archaeon]|nr:type II toxin-antitoxin system HicA family toxin [ANME-2 cluster archaeon]MBC2701180.1 type II toxin-antitoxin system HicA family toxin [ANME-2 cluster archaeon]MBC2707273.1 type II toxin-antitoxin system HicA family toxin [ANME-2 cluster archaeon]MBC2746576.1 type II toxin-antitoxin system HicA family toxin [ANME-2 cluster archaeon]MBC2762201.1 type II toxin-antitoxin system HicA family toxin [ANME-2 cluster archaeon]
MHKQKLLEDLKNNPKNIRFEKLCRIAEAFGFQFKGGKGSHRIYLRKDINEMLNFQNVSGKAKPYQVRQLIKIIDKYNLTEEDGSDV